MQAAADRTIDLASTVCSDGLKETSILCLPLGAIEQHGSHLPFETDVIVAEGLTRAIVAHWCKRYDLWQLPTIKVSLSREHDWSSGTQSLSIQEFTTLLRGLAAVIVRTLPSRNLVIVNGHGGNRGILENLLHELAGDFAINGCAIHPFDLSKAETGSTYPDVHGGKSETSVMLALAPDLVRRDRIGRDEALPDPEPIRALIFDRGVTWPWRTDDPRLAHGGIIGDARDASPELGQAIVDSIVTESGGVFARLLDNQRVRRART